MPYVIDGLLVAIFGFWTYAGLRCFLAREAVAELQFRQFRTYWRVDWPDRPGFRRFYLHYFLPGCGTFLLVVGILGLATTGLLVVSGRR